MFKIFFGISFLLLVLSGIFLILFSLPLGIDFKGGNIFWFKGKEFSFEKIEKSFHLQFKNATLQKVGEDEILVKAKEIDEKKLKEFFQKGGFSLQKKETVSARIGKTTQKMAFFCFLFAFFLILFYSLFSFGSFYYGVSAILALFHDVIIVLGSFSILGKIFQIELNLPFLTALLLIVGYSINDTIVIFDRFRERYKKQKKLEEAIKLATKESLRRSIFTSFTTLLSAGILFFLTKGILFSFCLAIILGIFIGTYSSLTFAPFLLYLFLRNK
jgi:preprotein translocase subunit SecF